MHPTSFDVQVICHGIPDKRPLQDGDIVNVDVTAYYKGYHGDLNETYVVGQVDDASKKLIRCAYDVSALIMHMTLACAVDVQQCFICLGKHNKLNIMGTLVHSTAGPFDAFRV